MPGGRASGGPGGGVDCCREVPEREERRIPPRGAVVIPPMFRASSPISHISITRILGRFGRGSLADSVRRGMDLEWQEGDEEESKGDE